MQSNTKKQNHSSPDRRKGEKPVPDNLEDHLNERQIQTLRRLEGFGYKLKFVRRPLFQDIVPVVVNPQEKKQGIITEDGSLDLYPDIELRW